MDVLENLKNALRPFEPWIPLRTPRLSWQRSLGALKNRGFAPVTVFDVGVGFGTFGLYQLFPDAFYHLIEPTPESQPHLQRIARSLSCQIHPLALGDRDGEARFEIRADIQGSTLLEEVGERDFLRFETVPMSRFDTLFPHIEGPALAKIDVQGAEMIVLRGMTGRIAELDAVIVETSTIATVKGGPEVADVVAFMREHGFVVADVLGLKRRPLDDATAQLDLLFVPQDSSLRADRRWAG
ncbi:MAG: FkbM family methyltransferase [Reyranella sp.]|uniref:FkbM family methyltransferase n=1 Tax=Reyranella sp. TaxID=1929291 RepID=UPI001AC53AF8|nr:FkbM family methyltransferase [Reyranella sp.]MBN9091323.1 FkbM family methyltransferase [Reyranella sp.]